MWLQKSKALYQNALYCLCLAVAEFRGGIVGDQWLNITIVFDVPVCSLILFILNIDWITRWRDDADTKNGGNTIVLPRLICRDTCATFPFNPDSDQKNACEEFLKCCDQKNIKIYAERQINTGFFWGHYAVAKKNFAINAFPKLTAFLKRSSYSFKRKISKILCREAIPKF